jgi:hypothetical protein
MDIICLIFGHIWLLDALLTIISECFPTAISEDTSKTIDISLVSFVLCGIELIPVGISAEKTIRPGNFIDQVDRTINLQLLDHDNPSSITDAQCFFHCLIRVILDIHQFYPGKPHSSDFVSSQFFPHVERLHFTR